MCSAASATLSVVISVTPQHGDKYIWDGQWGVWSSDVITIEFMESANIQNLQGINISANYGDYVEDSLVWQAGALGGASVTQLTRGYTIFANILYFPGTQAVNPILTWEFHVPDLSPLTWINIDITQGLYGGVAIDPSQIQIYTGIPEPMTIMLLGLGAVMLRKRR
jgi:hypothetical protein